MYACRSERERERREKYNTIFQFCCTVWGTSKRVRGIADSFFISPRAIAVSTETLQKRRLLLLWQKFSNFHWKLIARHYSYLCANLHELREFECQVDTELFILLYVDVNYFTSNLIKSYFNKFARERMSQFRLAIPPFLSGNIAPAIKQIRNRGFALLTVSFNRDWCNRLWNASRVIDPAGLHHRTIS